MKHGFISVAAASPKIRTADPMFNANEMARIATQSADKGIKVLVFPELSLTGATCKDLFFSNTLLCGAKAGLTEYLKQTADLSMVSVVGLPLCIAGKLYNVAAVCHKGLVMGFVPKTNVSSNDTLSDARYFQSAASLDACGYVEWCGEEVACGTDLLFTCSEMPSLKLAVEIGNDLGASYHAPSAEHAAAGAAVICNPAASNETVGAAQYRKMMVLSQSARTKSVYIYASAGDGESTTDLVFGGHCLIAENGVLLAEKKPFSAQNTLIAQPDLENVIYERRRSDSFLSEPASTYGEIYFELPLEETKLTRIIDPHPFVPADEAELFDRCETILSIQANGLKTRIERAYAQKIVLGISGGLDSTLALLVMARAIDLLERPRTDIIAVTMPCFGTTKRTKNNATVLCEELGVDFRCVDIFDAVNQHFRDIGHDPENRNVVYENAQARERTQILMDIANGCGGMVIGTGDLSELALGWATYNGDQMSMYGVNADIPKTLVRHIVAHCAAVAQGDGNRALAGALLDVVNTPVSPELLPANENGEIAQKTEDLVGPYEIHDFYLYYMLRYGYSPEKLYRLACHALGVVYDKETLKKWLKTFVRRFFSQQFKRSCMPDGPKVGSIGLSPRGDWMMPSDAAAALWTQEAERI